MKLIIKLFLFLCLLAVGALAALAYYVNYTIQQPINFPDNYIYNLSAGSSLSKLTKDLSKEGLLPSPYPLLIYARVNKLGNNLHAGEYEFKSGMNSLEIIKLLEKGEVLKYYITFVEGWSFREIYKEFKKHEKIKITLSENDFEKIMAKIDGKKELHPEGQFFPDTYQYQTGMSDIQILKRAHQRLTNVLNEEWEKKASELPYKNAYEALIMASLVEKETGAPEERPEIAGVFVRRLNLKMRLETDPTVIYGLGKDFKGNITRAHLRKKTAYNTYRIHGLPPTPIALVGREAINAALNPKAGETLYFVAKGDGTHYFSKTYAEHLKAVRKYQIKERKKDYRSSPSN